MFKKIASAVVEHIHETKVASTPSSEATSPVKQTPTTQKASANKVTVCVRVRPRNQKEIDAEMPEFFAPTDDGLNIQEKKEDVASGELDVVKNWSYDYCFGKDNDNKYIFHSVGSELVDATLDGYNAVMFMYGQTSSGKTFTLFGGGEQHPGIIDFAIQYLQKRVQESKDAEYLIKMTYSELYNEEIKDLLSAEGKSNLKIMDDPQLGPYVQGITEHSYSDADKAKKCLLEGEERRHFGVTNMNAHSSRSHVLVRFTVESRKVTFEPTTPLRSSWGRDKPTSVATLNLVDLAGSERANKSGTSGQALKEGSYINKSLLTLGTVIFNLSEGKHGQHIPYRNSKLTRLLSSALGGNARTTMISCVSPASGNVLESLSTLRFASRAKKIVNQVKRNEIMDAKTLANKLNMQSDMIESLKAKLALGVSSNDAENISVRDKAVKAARDARSLRGLIMSAPRMITSLRMAGRHELMEQVQEDLKQGLTGRRDMGDIITSHIELLHTHIPQERELMERLVDIGQKNDVEDLDNSLYLEEGRASGEGDDGEDMRASGGALHSATRTAVPAEDEEAAIGLTDFLGAVMGGGGESSEILEEERMRYEDLLSGTAPVVYRLQMEHNATLGLKEQYKLKYQEGLGKQEILSKELTAEKQSKKQLEEDAARHRADLKGQMEKLRGNMHALLQDKGESSALMEQRSSEMERAMDEMKDELQVAQDSRKRLGMELKSLGLEVNRMTTADYEKGKDIARLREQLVDKRREVERGQIAIVNNGAKISLSEQGNAKLSSQVQDLQRKLERSELLVERERKRAAAERNEAQRVLREQLAQQQHDFDMTAEELRSTQRVQEQQIQQLQEDLDLAESRNEDLASTERRLTTRHVKSERDLMRQIRELEVANGEAKKEAEVAKDNLAALEKIIKAELVASKNDQALLEEAAEAETEAERRVQASHAQSPRTSSLREEQGEYLKGESPHLPHFEEGVSSEEYSRIHRALKLSTAFLKYSLLESGAHMHTDRAVLQHNHMELMTLRRTQAVLASQLDKSQRACSIYESEHAADLQAKMASFGYIDELEDTVKRMRSEHDRAIEAQAQAEARAEELQTRNDFLTIAQMRLDSEVASLQADLATTKVNFDRVYGELNATKSKLIRSEVDLGEKEQRLEVLEVERDELARQYYRFGDSTTDLFTAIGGDTTGESGKDSELDSIGGDKDRKEKVLHSLTHNHHEKRSHTSHTHRTSTHGGESEGAEAEKMISPHHGTSTHRGVEHKRHGGHRNSAATVATTGSTTRPKHPKENKKVPHYMQDTHHTGRKK
jgi:hypothetical protein